MSLRVGAMGNSAVVGVKTSHRYTLADWHEHKSALDETFGIVPSEGGLKFQGPPNAPSSLSLAPSAEQREYAALLHERPVGGDFHATGKNFDVWCTDMSLGELWPFRYSKWSFFLDDRQDAMLTRLLAQVHKSRVS